MAASHPEEPVALDARSWVICGGLGSYPETEEAFRLLTEHHIKDVRLAPVCEIAPVYLSSYPVVQQFLRAALNTNPFRQIRGKAAYGLALGLDHVTRQQLVNDPKGTADRQAQVEPLLELVLKDYADVPTYRGTLGEEAAGVLFRRRHLAIGKKAPDFECVDAKGVPRRLSDFRGKVVVLDFWYVECGPCRVMFPHLRELAERYAGRPFALIGVTYDKDKAKWLSFLKKEPLPGTQCYSGPKGLVSRWGIYEFPYVYVIDAGGTIRYRRPRPDELDRAISKLVLEAESK